MTESQRYNASSASRKLVHLLPRASSKVVSGSSYLPCAHDKIKEFLQGHLEMLLDFLQDAEFCDTAYTATVVYKYIS